MSEPKDTPLTIIDKKGNVLRLKIDSKGKIIQQNGKGLSLDLKYDQKNVEPNSDGYFLLETNPEQNNKQCRKKIKISRKKVRCQYIEGHGASHIYYNGGTEYVDKNGKRVVKRGFYATPVSFENGW